MELKSYEKHKEHFTHVCCDFFNWTFLNIVLGLHVWYEENWTVAVVCSYEGVDPVSIKYGAISRISLEKCSGDGYRGQLKKVREGY